MMTLEPRRGVTAYESREGAPVFLSDMIMELGFASKEHVEAAVETARSSGETVGRILVREGRLSEDQLARALAARYGLNHIDLAEFDVDPGAANLLPPAAAQRYRAVPVEFQLDGSLLVAMADPSDSLALNDIAFMTKLEVHAAVAAENLIAELVRRLPLPPSETRSSGFPTPAPAPPAPEPFAPPAAPNPELSTLRAELDSVNTALDDERSKHAAVVAELRQELQHAHSEPMSHDSEELAEARSELERVREKLGRKKEDLERARSDLQQEREEVDRLRSELGHKGAELDRTREELGHKQGETDGLRHELDQVRSELDVARGEAARAGEALSRLDELDQAEARVTEAHATLEKMRHEFELEREQHAATERDLRGLLASEAERHEALQEAHAVMQKRLDALRSQNAALLDAYATAKRWSEEFARGARELANTLEQPVLDDAVRAQQATGDPLPPLDNEPPLEGPGRFSRDDGAD
jgi:predicted  nucleic acid-binding Zn-ribbon protein